MLGDKDLIGKIALIKHGANQIMENINCYVSEMYNKERQIGTIESINDDMYNIRFEDGSFWSYTRECFNVIEILD